MNQLLAALTPGRVAREGPKGRRWRRKKKEKGKLQRKKKGQTLSDTRKTWEKKKEGWERKRPSLNGRIPVQTSAGLQLPQLGLFLSDRIHQRRLLHRERERNLRRGLLREPWNSPAYAKSSWSVMPSTLILPTVGGKTSFAARKVHEAGGATVGTYEVLLSSEAETQANLADLRRRKKIVRQKCRLASTLLVLPVGEPPRIRIVTHIPTFPR